MGDGRLERFGKTVAPSESMSVVLVKEMMGNLDKWSKEIGCTREDLEKVRICCGFSPAFHTGHGGRSIRSSWLLA